MREQRGQGSGTPVELHCPDCGRALVEGEAGAGAGLAPDSTMTRGAVSDADLPCRPL